MWATLLAGAPGFVQAPGPDRLHVAATPAPGDALRPVLGAPGTPGAAVGLTAIDLATRRRARVNGRLARVAAEGAAAAGFVVAVEEAYGNCPKYIQARTPPAPSAAAPPGEDAEPDADALSDAQRAWLAAADTAFVASVGPNGRADASHRGGAPGFLVAVNAHTLVLPDYAGNTMFNTLGNLAEDPRIGVVVPDFARGRLLQLSGTAAVDWRPEAAALFPGAERVVVVRVARAREVAGAIPPEWSAPVASPFNPPPPR